MKDAPAHIKTAEKIVKQISDARASDRRVEQDLLRIQNSLSELRELLKLIESGLPQRLAEIQRITPLIAKHQQVMVGYDEQKMHIAQAYLFDYMDHQTVRLDNEVVQNDEQKTLIAQA